MKIRAGHILPVFWALSAANAIACSCTPYTFCQWRSRNGVIFVGEVVAGGLLPHKGPYTAHIVHRELIRVRVKEVLHGSYANDQEVTIRVWFGDGMCAIRSPYTQGETVLVGAAVESKNLLSDGGCKSPTIMAARAGPEIEALRRARDHADKGILAGRVSAAAIDTYALPPLAPPVANVRVTARSETTGEVVETYSHENGGFTFEFSKPGPEVISLNAQLPPFRTQSPDAPLTVTTGSCVIQNIGLIPQNSVQGRVYNSKGRLLGGTKLVLRGDHWGAAATADNDGNYQFSKLPPGDYRLLVEGFEGSTANSLRIVVGPDSQLRGQDLHMKPR